MRNNWFLPFYLAKCVFSKFRLLPKRAKIYGTLGLGTLLLWPQYNKRSIIQQEMLHRKSITDYVYLDFAVNNLYIGRILIGLYGFKLPLSVENFIQMCKGFDIGDKQIGYRNTKVSRIVPKTAILMGDLFYPTDPIQSCTIYSKTIPEEGFETSFVQEGDVALLSNGPFGNTSQFFITLSKNPGLQQKSVVIGTIVKGMKLIRWMSEEDTIRGIPTKDIRIINCGIYKDANDGPKSYFVDPSKFATPG
ncbi:bifunctional Cyclophilin-like domain superfamily/Cyclophilin-type peptidyl-prolyl cis-trans isomerase domain [Babesia duncani]|uniref:Peptidyl-prolyl cis-trans isomerase n=1 Tax=Babesia duncani TaxID=323732 RepID=A0AAD9UPN6_9APIC|nr:bifunctional Cyclophilin-like domain superfamily/Cyclophilin-type peptidyl-prolyl cis-trans isomerase domain [Babesia duncani]